MINMTEQEHKQNLILKFIDKSLSPKEKATFEKLQQTDKYFDVECRELSQISAQTKKVPLPQFNYKPFNKKKKFKVIPLIPVKWVKVAAVLLIGIFIGIGSFYYISHDKNQFLKVSTERGDKIKVELPDGINVWLNSRSEITYNASFTGSNRIIELKGEAFFSMAKNISPFSIKSFDNEIICTNGAFNIENDTMLHTTEIEVKSGWVALSSPNTNNQQFIVEEGFKGKINDYIPIWIEQNTNPNYLAWHTGKLSFHKTTLKDVAEVLMDVYDVEISLTNETKFCLISNTFYKQDLNSILKEIVVNLNLKIKRTDHSILITGSSC